MDNFKMGAYVAVPSIMDMVKGEATYTSERVSDTGTIHKWEWSPDRYLTLSTVDGNPGIPTIGGLGLKIPMFDVLLVKSFMTLANGVLLDHNLRYDYATLEDVSRHMPEVYKVLVMYYLDTTK